MRKPRRLPQYCYEDTDRHGNVRVYLRKPGQPKIRLRGMAWTPAFMEAYERALNGEATEDKKPTLEATTHATWKWLCMEYMRSANFRLCNPETQKNRRRVLESTWVEPINPTSKLTFGDMPITQFNRDAARVLRDRKVDFPSAAITRLKMIGYVCSYGVQVHSKLMPANPARQFDNSQFKGHGDGRHVWTVDKIRQFESHHKPGSSARRAMTILLYSGARPCDVRLLGRQNVRKGTLKFKPAKTKKSSGVEVEIPVLPALARELELTPGNQLTYIVSKWGKPYELSGSFREWFKDECRSAGLPHCSPGGLRPAGATLAAENGASSHQLMAIYGWTKVETAEKYTRTANRKKLAGSGLPLLTLEENE